jgi:hypothetical protein
MCPISLTNIAVVETGGWVGSRAGLDKKAREKIILPLTGIEPWSSGRPALSQTLYWLSYPAQNCILIRLNISYLLFKTSEIKKILSTEWFKAYSVCNTLIFLECNFNFHIVGPNYLNIPNLKIPLCLFVLLFVLQFVTRHEHILTSFYLLL